MNKNKIIDFILTDQDNQAVSVYSNIPEPVLDTEPTPVASQQVKNPTVVDVVRKSNVAVVSIVGMKDVPKYDVVYNDTNVFGGIFRTPTYVQNGTEKKKTGSGTGFLISSDGYIVTNKHVVSDTSASYSVTLNNSKVYDATVLARDDVLDVAILKVSSTDKFSYLQLGDSDSIEVGQSVVAIGNALGQFKNTVSVGVVSGLSRSVTASTGGGGSEKLSKVIQTDAAINPGNSGGPLLDINSNVIGVNVAVVSGSENIGFALPINSIKSVIDSVRKTGSISRPYVGVRYVTINPEIKKSKGLTVDYGVWITKGSKGEPAIVPNSPAEKAGIKEGDVILEIDGQKIDEEGDFTFLIRDKNVGDYVELKVLSGNIIRLITIKLEKVS
ncbi:MAG: trypsin-like peptidase domain-containing protein [Candidatus Pacebacteria bacterium]|nr:trypsin-like peptidase domain-containing protein [Candidatus Paceibacterota bacterium]MBP9715933.1 trypsin-like peptidase domain-containing protein [Candidatus Paceibacterota bacterium]